MDSSSELARHKSPHVITQHNSIIVIAQAAQAARDKPAPVTGVSGVRSPPDIPPRNGSKLEHSEGPVKSGQLEQKFFDTNIHLHLLPQSGDSETKEASGEAEKNKNGSYRENWKQRQEQQNTLVFNFVNTKKDVSHIENDGMDLSRRNKKVIFNIYILT